MQLIWKERKHVTRKYLYPELCGKIREIFRTQESFARAIGMNPSTLSGKLAGRSQWSYSEVVRVCSALGIPMSESWRYFFTPNVARLQHYDFEL